VFFEPDDENSRRMHVHSVRGSALLFGTARSVSIVEAAYVGTISDADYRASFTMVREAGSNEEVEGILAI